ncbi:MAG TPA: hypothetical protein VMI33_24200 [Streptosporangiaceae bacterium]|nr:hypothetical protein [Streptosporangiaceae bacterium]
MRIRFTRAGYALAAGVAVTAMLGMSAASASTISHRPHSFATSACGVKCTDVSFQVPGPSFILGVHSGLQVPNTVVRLLQGSNTAFKEDFSRIDVGTVVPLYCTITGQAQTGSLFTSNQCHLMIAAGLAFKTTFQMAYNPNNGGTEQLCIGGWDNEVANGWKLRLTHCGVAADTVMIATGHLPGGSTSGGSDWWVNGASDNYSTPLVATSESFAPSQPTWTQVVLNGTKAADTQEVHTKPGPF